MGKKILTILLTLYLVLAASVSLDAATLTADGESVKVPVKYSVNNTEYIITIPAEITLDSADTSFEITAEKMNLRPDEEVIVKISSGCDSNGVVTLTRQQSDEANAPTLSSTLSQNGVNIATNEYIVGKFVDGENSTANTLGAIIMSAPKIDENTKAGDYLGTIQFEVELRKAQNE